MIYIGVSRADERSLLLQAEHSSSGNGVMGLAASGERPVTGCRSTPPPWDARAFPSPRWGYAGKNLSDDGRAPTHESRWRPSLPQQQC